ncbi:MAG: phosphoribosylamine--glycine ligase [Candidatus Pacebacteria bacterium]|nr:phosphoribosylamine--glycine ligase [Candidatus Paceibacterota bacterium]
MQKPSAVALGARQKILIIGAGGGREHALGWKIAQSPQCGQIFFAPGNAGTLKLGINVDIKTVDIPKLIEFAKKENIDLTLAASDGVLATDLVEEFRKANLRIWGPTKAAAHLEWSKTFSKDFMYKHNLPTAKFKIFNKFEEAKDYISRQSFPIVIKADGLAFGKGVIIAQNIEEANTALEEIMVKKIFGDSGNEVVIEEFLIGHEISIHALSDGSNYKIFPSSQDHKRIFEGDKGPNTGGMGVIGPLPFVSGEMMERIEKEVIAPTLKGMMDDGVPFEGILYPSLMLTKDGPKIIEFNTRFGDPECQVYMRLLDTDLLAILNACVDKKLNEQEIKWKNVSACNIALASGGYPENYEKGKIITGIDEAEMQPDIVVFHAGSKMENGKLVTSGGRVLGVSAIGNSLEEALAKAYKAIEKISFRGMQYRKDIGQSALKTEKI